MNTKNTNINDPAGDDSIEESRDPVDADVSSTEGEGGDGAGSSDPGKTAGDSKERDPVDSTNPADDDDSKTDAEADNFDDVLDALTNPKEEAPKDQADAEEDEDEEESEEVADDDESEGDEEADDEEPENDDGEAEDKVEENAEKSDDSDADPELDPTPDERKRLSRSVNKKIDKLLKLKGPARFGEAVADFADKAGFNDKSLRAWLETGKRVNRGSPDEAVEELVSLAINVRTNGKLGKMSKAEKAQALRDIANRISPAPEITPEVITVPQDLAEAVSEERLSQEEAEMIARARAAKAKGKTTKTAESQQQTKTEEVDETKTESNNGRWYSDAEFEEGRAEAAKVYKEYAQRYKADWPRISKRVLDAVAKESVSVHPSGFARLVRDKAELVLANLRKAAKKPPKSPTPTNNAPPKKKVDPADWSENDLLDRVTGKKSW